MFFTLHAARGISFSFARRTREWYAIIASRKQSALLVLTSSKLIVSKVYTRALGGFYTDESEKKKRTIIFIDIISPPRTNNNNLRSLHGGGITINLRTEKRAKKREFPLRFTGTQLRSVTNARVYITRNRIGVCLARSFFFAAFVHARQRHRAAATRVVAPDGRLA